MGSALASVRSSIGEMLGSYIPPTCILTLPGRGVAALPVGTSSRCFQPMHADARVIIIVRSRRLCGFVYGLSYMYGSAKCGVVIF